MEYYRCLDNLFGYCNDKPEMINENSNKCSKNCKTCGNYMTFLQSVKAQLTRAKEKMPEWTQHKSFVKLVGEVGKIK